MFWQAPMLAEGFYSLDHIVASADVKPVARLHAASCPKCIAS